MKEWIGDHAVAIFFVTLIIVCSSVVCYKSYLDRLNDKEVVVDGKIINVEYLGVAEGYITYNALKLTFDNGESYTIVTGDDIDFTANSKFIIKLFWDGDDEYWEIVNMYKVPSED